jgi:hypothetical protein
MHLLFPLDFSTFPLFVTGILLQRFAADEQAAKKAQRRRQTAATTEKVKSVIVPLPFNPGRKVPIGV